MREQLIAAGIRNLKDFGYPKVDRNNIITDMIYSIFFKRLLEGTIEDAQGRRILIDACNGLLAEIQSASGKNAKKKKVVKP